MEKKINRKQLKLSICLVLGILVPIVSGCSNAQVSVNSVKILLDEDGIYKVGVDALAKEGLNLDSIDPKRLRLSNRGEPVPLFVIQGEGSTCLEFHGQESTSDYSRENIYILEALNKESEQTILVDQKNGFMPTQTVPVHSEYFSVQRYEKNQLYFPQVYGSDNWYWATVSGGQTQAFPFSISEVMPGEGYIRLDLWSNTEAPADPDHHIVLRINNRTVIDTSWDGRGWQLFTASIPDGILVEGDNQVFFEVPGDTQAAAEAYWINWFEITHPRRSVAQMEVIKFVADGQPLLLSGFSGQVNIFDVTEYAQVNLPFIATASDGNLVFTGQEGHTYYAIGEEGFREPLLITPVVNTPKLRANTRSADYLAIGPNEYLAAAQDLFDHREARGITVEQIPLQAIYDQYNYGFPEPEAIQSFLIEARRSWEIALKYVLLLGDASYDPKNYLQQAVTNILPSFFIQTTYGGQTVSDIPFADLDSDGTPDIALGRIPASTTGEVALAVRKIIQHENASDIQDGKIRILAIADGQEVGFRIDAQHFLDIFPPNEKMDLFTPIAGITDANESIQAYFNDGGYSYVVYFGHGSIVMWGKDRLLSVEDVSALNNNNFPVVINMTCLTGLFTHPRIESLTEAFLFNPSGGAVAVLAPTSLTLSGEQNRLSTPLAEALGGGGFERLGDAYLFTQRKMAQDSPDVADVLETFLLFGDPGMVIDTSR